MIRRLLPGIGLLAALATTLTPIVAPGLAAAAEAPASIYPMLPGAWVPSPPPKWIPEHPAGRAGFARIEGMPDGIMTIGTEDLLVSRDARFADGTIEFDIKPLEYGDTGIVFRRHGTEAGEFVYLRADPNCPAANDCIQYAPITHGLMPWNLYSSFQGPAPISTTGWNHLRLVVAGPTLRVFVNRDPEPVLTVARLRAGVTKGGIAFKGAASYANLVIRPASPGAAPALLEAAPPPGTVTAWQAAPPTALADGQPVAAADIPAEPRWRPIEAASDGLVDLGRAFGAGRAPAVSTGWLRFALDAGAPERRLLRLGWEAQVTVFLNGRPVFAGDNPYFPAERRLSPDGRLAPDNALVPLNLVRGRNQVVLAVGNRWRTAAGATKPSPYGWGAEARVVAMEGPASR